SSRIAPALPNATNRVSHVVFFEIDLGRQAACGIIVAIVRRSGHRRSPVCSLRSVARLAQRTESRIMRLDTSQQMRTEMRLRMARRMIQSMEILQLPILALQERIEQELSENPVLVDLRESTPAEAEGEEAPAPAPAEPEPEPEEPNEFDSLIGLDENWSEIY